MPEFSALSPPDGTAKTLLGQLNPSDPTFIKAPLLLDAVAFGFVYFAAQQDTITAVKNTVVATTNEIREINASLENWRLRKEILLSKWPTDPAQQAALITALQDDAATPPPKLPDDDPITGAPGVQLASLDEINQSKARAQTILDLLVADQADADAGRSLPTAPLSSTGDGVLNAAVGDWLQAQGLDFSKDTWDSALLPDGNGGYASYSNAALTTPWTVKVPGVLTTPAGVTFIALSDGTITPSVAERVTGKSLVELSATYDLSLIPESFKGNIAASTNPLPYDLYTVGSTTYVTFASEFVPAAQGLYPGVAALYGQLIPDSLGASASGTSRYWSDGSTIYKFDLGVDADGDPNMLNLGNTTLHISPPYTGAQIAAQWNNVFAVQTVGRLPQASDMKQMANAADAVLSKLGNSSSQWASIADAQKLQLNEAITLYGNASNWITNLLERLERGMTTQIQAIT